MVTLPEEANIESARLLATQDGVQYFAAENDDATAACVAVVPSGEEPLWIAGCSIGNVTGEIVMVTGRNGVLSTKLVADGFDTQKLESVGWTKIADNLLVHGLQRFTNFEVFSEGDGMSLRVQRGLNNGNALFDYPTHGSARSVSCRRHGAVPYEEG